MYRWLIMMLIWGGLISGLLADAGSLIGIVKDKESGELLPNASIRLQEVNKGISSDEDGAFSLRDIPVGEYTLIVEYIGYHTYQTKVMIGAEAAKLTIDLQPTPLRGREVTVVSLRAKEGETPTAFSTLTNENIDERYYAQDIPLLLSELPSTKYYSESGNGIGYNHLSIRGFDQRRISVMINGIPQNDPEDHNVYWVNFPDFLGSTQDIQVQRGSGSAFYGPPAIGGSVNIITKDLSGDRGISAFTGFGSYNTRKLSLGFNSGLMNDKFIVFGRISQIKTDGYRDRSAVDFRGYFFGGAYLGKRSTFKINIYGGPIEDQLVFLGIPKEDTADRELRRSNPIAGENEKENFNQPHLELLHTYQLNESTALNNTLFGIRGYGFFDYDGSWAPFSYFRLTPEFGFDVIGNPEDQYASEVLIRANVDNKQVGWLPNITWQHARGQVIGGAEIRVHRSEHWGRIQEGSDDLPQAVSGEYRGLNYIGDRQYYEYKGAKNILSPYVQTTYQASPKVAVNAALQYVYQNYRLYDEAFIGTDFDLRYNFLNPRIGINFTPTPKTNLFVSFARTSREPRLKNYYDAAEASTPASWGAVVPQFERNPDGSFNYDSPFVKPEQLNDFEVGFGYRVRGNFANVNLFYMDFRDEIVKSGQLDRFGQPVTGNADRTLHAGIELSGGLEFLRKFTAVGNFTYSQNELKEYVVYDGAGTPIDLSGNPIAGFPDIIANLRLTYGHRGFSISMAMQHVGKQFTDNFGDQSPYASVTDENFVDAYTAFHGVLAYDFGKTLSLSKLSLQLHIQNIFDTLYNTHGEGAQFFPAAERHAFANLKFEL